MFEYDELKVYRGSDIHITDKIIVIQPTVGDIEEFGEKKHFSAVHTLTSVGADLKWQLWDIGIDYTEISDYDLFIKLIHGMVSSKKILINELSNNPQFQSEIDKLDKHTLEEMCINPLQLVLKDIDLGDFKPCKLNNTEEIVLYNKDEDITIDRSVYARIVDIVRQIYGFKRNNQIPANEATKMDLIEDAKDEYMAAQNKPFKSILKPLISSLTNHSGFSYGHNEIWDMKIGAFFDSVKRINKIQDATLLMQGAYSGFASLKGIDKERLNWTGDI